MSDWRSATLGDLFEVSNSRLGPHEVEPTVMSLSKHHGFVRAEDYFDKRVASAKLDAYKVVPEGGWAFSTIHIDEGSIARNMLGETGVISPMYTTMTWKSAVDLPEYGALLVRERRIVEEYRRRAQGSVNRRRSLSFKAFSAIDISMPSAAEQRRIVEVVASVDRAIAAQTIERDAAERLYRAFRDASFANLASHARSVPLGEVISEVKRPVAVEPSAQYRQIGVRSHGRGVFTKEPVVGEDLGSKKVFWVEPGDLVINIVFGWEGAVATIPENLHGHCGSHRFPTYRRPDNGAIDYVRHFLLSRRGIEVLGLASPGGAGRNRTLNRRRLGEFMIPFPEDDRQREVVGALVAMESQSQALSVELESLRRFRSTLVSALLSRQIEVPDSYDRLMEAAS